MLKLLENLESVSPLDVRLAPVAAHCGFTGFQSPARDYELENLSLDAYLGIKRESHFYFQAEGESMTGLGIQDGEILVVDASLEPEVGDLCICILEGQFLAKMIELRDEKPMLVSSNEQYPPVEVWNGVEIVGVVTGKVTKLSRKERKRRAGY